MGCCEGSVANPRPRPWGLESLAADRLVEVASVLGHHYATAGEHE